MKPKWIAATTAAALGMLALLIAIEFLWLGGSLLPGPRPVSIQRRHLERLLSLFPGNQPVGGMEIASQAVPLTGASLASHDYQKYLEYFLDEHLLGRPFLIRLKGEVYFRLFDIAINQLGVVLGKEDVIYGDLYLKEYCRTRGEIGPTRALVERLKALQDRCRAAHKGFCVVITPSKASLYPEAIPAEWAAQFDPKPRAIDQWRECARQSGLAFVDGPRLAQDLKGTVDFPLFPKGGVHWSWFLSNRTADAVLEALWNGGRDAPRLVETAARTGSHPSGEDYDMVSMMNLLVKWRYPVYLSEIVPAPAGNRKERTNLSIVGGSFCNKMAEALGRSNLFSRVEFYFYYRVSCATYADGGSQVSHPVPDAGHIYESGALILEMNEENLLAPHHIKAFLDELEAASPGATP